MDRKWLQVEPQAEAVFNVLPCNIKYDGAVEGSKLNVENSETSDGEPRARLRGRALYGKTVDLDGMGYVGHTLEEEARQPRYEESGDDENENENENESEFENEASGDVRLVPTGPSFSRLVVWEHGMKPLAGDPWAFKIEELLGMAKYL